MKINLLVQEFCDYSQYIRGYADDTIKRYRRVVSLFTKYAEIEDIDQINDENTKGFFFNGRTLKNWSSNTFVCYHKTLVVFFRWCVEQGHMEANLAQDIETPKIEKRLPPKLTKQEASRLLEVVYNYPYKYKFLRYRNHAIFTTFLFTGIRRKELLNLKYADVDLDNLTIFIRQGKGNKDRIIPMNYKLVSILQKYSQERARLGKTCPEFFVSLNRNMGFKEIGLRRLVAKMKQISDINFNVHRLRHTFATLMLEGGCDIYSLSKIMGHSDIKTTTIYLAASSEHLRGQIMKHPLI
jgi:site-specific recombinase XerD